MEKKNSVVKYNLETLGQRGVTGFAMAASQGLSHAACDTDPQGGGLEDARTVVAKWIWPHEALLRSCEGPMFHKHAVEKLAFREK